MPSSCSRPCQCRRVELVLLHEAGSEPRGTGPWLDSRPALARHHHVRLTHLKVRSSICQGTHVCTACPEGQAAVAMLPLATLGCALQRLIHLEFCLPGLWLGCLCCEVCEQAPQVQP